MNATTNRPVIPLTCKQMLNELETVPLFKNVDAYILNLLEPFFEPYSCPGGSVIFEQGEPAHYLYLILDGVVEILYKPYDGPQLTLTSLVEGSIIGWSAVVGNATYTSKAVCKEDIRAIRMTSRNLHELCAAEPEAGRIILDLLAESVSSRWQNAREQIQTLLNSSINARQCENGRKRRRKMRKAY